MYKKKLHTEILIYIFLYPYIHMEGNLHWIKRHQITANAKTGRDIEKIREGCQRMNQLECRETRS